MIPSLLLVLAVATLLYSWRLGASGLSTYYASSAKSMAGDWHAFVLGGLDPAATWTLDKLSGFLIPQALAIRVFGFHPWVLDLPQVLEGLVTVLMAYVIGARWRGPAIGLGIAGVVTLTPMLAAMFGRPMEDGMLTMTMALAFAAVQRAVISDRIGWLLLSGTWVAVGFQAKMLQAWLILPALLLAYWVGSRESRSRRTRNLLVAGAATVLLSVAWLTVIQFSARSGGIYVDGSTNNNVFSMVFGYNGIDRIVPGLVPGGVPQLDTQHGSAVVNGTATQDAGHSVLKLFLPEFVTQIGWLYPPVLVGVVAEIVAARRKQSATPAEMADRAVVVGAVAWLLITCLVLSAAFVPHATYFGMIALPLALFAVIGFARAVHLYRFGSGACQLLLPALVGVQVAWGSAIAITSPRSTRMLAIPIFVVGISAVVGLVLGLRHRLLHGVDHNRLVLLPIAVAVMASLLGPAIWSSFVLGPGGGGSASDAYAGPREDSPTAANGSRPRGKINPNGASEQARLLAYVERHGAGPTLFATDTLAIAVAVNLSTGREVMPMGGFSRQAPWPSQTWLLRAIETDRVRFVLLAESDTGTPSNAVLAQTRSWTKSTCRAVMRGAFRIGSNTQQVLYDCGAW